MISPLDQRPVLVALAGPNGSGKTTFYHAHLKPCGLPLVNADVLARELNLDPYAAAKLVARFPRTLANLRAAIEALPHVLVFDNDDLRRPFRRVAVFEQGRAVALTPPAPRWLEPLLKSGSGR
jgi:predicted ABC-type ATPase